MLSNFPRLTIQQIGDSSCSQKEICVDLGDIPSPAHHSSTNTGVSGDQDDTITYIVNDAQIGSTQLTEFEHAMDDEDMLDMIKKVYDIDEADTGVVIPSSK